MNKFVIAAALSAAALASTPAFAQTAAPGVTGYGNLGYSHLDPNGVDLNSLGARLGARFGNYLGIEGEGYFGVGSHDTTVAGLPASDKLAHSFAAYAVGYYPVSPNFDLLARIGYGTNRLNTTVGGASTSLDRDSINYGAGGQYFFTPKDGIRAEYTRADYRDNGGHANIWGVSYVRKF
jgi:outer membrane immunogenic protein